MGSPDRREKNPFGGQIETTDPDLSRPDLPDGPLVNGNGALKARLGLDGDGQVCIIKPLPNGEFVAVPFIAKPNGENPT